MTYAVCMRQDPCTFPKSLKQQIVSQYRVNYLIWDPLSLGFVLNELQAFEAINYLFYYNWACDIWIWQ